MKNERILRRKRHIKLLKKRTKQLKKKLEGKRKEWNSLEKERIEKRVSKWLKKFGGKFEKRVRPKTMKKMRDAYRARQKGKQVKTVDTAKLDARMKSGRIIGESNETY